MILVNLIFLAGTALFFLVMIFTSWREKEKRAALFSVLGFLAGVLLWGLFLVFPPQGWLIYLNGGLAAGAVAFLFFSLLPFFPPRHGIGPEFRERFDERDHMFSRNNLKFHPELYREYYNRYPDREAADSLIHSQPELGDPSQRYHDSLLSPVFDAAFSLLDKIRPFARGEANPERKPVDPDSIAGILKQLARYYGAVDVGISSLKPHHLYSHSGRHAADWGRAVTNQHISALVIVVAMDVDMMKQAPSLPAILESSRQYVEAAKIACLIAEYLRLLGYDARAHTDGNYDTLCVPLAVSSGLGELGRMGILVHKVYGPCVRLSVVTTELELPVSEEKVQRIDEFCRICKKCADNCPTKSITSGDPQASRGFPHWSIDQERCFSIWKKIGTDCGFCIRVCPYTKPDTILHRMVRFYVSRNPVNQRIALMLDDLFYGRKPKIPLNNPDQIFRKRQP